MTKSQDRKLNKYLENKKNFCERNKNQPFFIIFKEFICQKFYQT